MKKIFFAALTAALTIVSVTAFADNGKAPFHSNRAADNIFVTVKGGANSVLDNGTFRIGGPAAAVEAGKWLTPWTAVRFGWQGVSNRAADSANGWFSGEDPFGFNTVHAAWILDATAAVLGYKPDRAVNVRPYIKAGAVFTSYDGRNDTELAAGAGVELAVRLTQRLSAVADVSSLWAREEAWRGAGKAIAFPSATAGLAVALGRTSFARHADTVREVRVTEDCRHEEVIAALRDEIAALRARKPDTVTVEKVLMTEFTVFFNIDKWDLLRKEEWHLADLVRVLPEGASLQITGHADKETGSHQRNEFLSRKRAETVEAALRRLGFKGTVKAGHKGDRENPYGEPTERNRAVTIKISF